MIEDANTLKHLLDAVTQEEKLLHEREAEKSVKQGGGKEAEEVVEEEAMDKDVDETPHVDQKGSPSGAAILVKKGDAGGKKGSATGEVGAAPAEDAESETVEDEERKTEEDNNDEDHPPAGDVDEPLAQESEGGDASRRSSDRRRVFLKQLHGSKREYASRKGVAAATKARTQDLTALVLPPGKGWVRHGRTSHVSKGLRVGDATARLLERKAAQQAKVKHLCISVYV